MEALLKFVLSCLVTACCILMPGQSYSTTSFHDDLVGKVTAFVLDAHPNAKDINVSVQKIDSRVALAECTDENLQIDWLTGSRRTGSTSISVACQSEKPWKIFFRTKVELFDDILVLSKPVLAGETLSTENTTLKTVSLNTLRHEVIRSADGLHGYQFKRRYSADRPISLRMLSPPLLVKRGQDVILVAEAGGLRVRMKGVALADGEHNARISVRNSNSKRVVQGVVSNAGTVNVTF